MRWQQLTSLRVLAHRATLDFIKITTRNTEAFCFSYFNKKKFKHSSTPDLYTNFFLNNNGCVCYGGGHKKDRNSLERNVDLRWVRLTEMPLKELLRSLWLLALLTLVLAWFQAETQSTLGSNLLKICLGSRKSIHQPQAPPQEWPPEIFWPVAGQGHWEVRTGSVNQQPSQLLQN